MSQRFGWFRRPGTGTKGHAVWRKAAGICGVAKRRNCRRHRLTAISCGCRGRQWQEQQRKQIHHATDDNKKETANASAVFRLRMMAIFGDADKWLVSGHAGAELVEEF